MPDQDIVERTLRKQWKSNYRLIYGGQSPAETVARSLCQSLAAVLREDGGLLGFDELWGAYSEALARPDGARTLAMVARKMEQRFGQQRGAKILARAAQVNLAESQAGRALAGPRTLAESYLRLYLEHEFFSKIRAGLIGPAKRFHDAASQQRFVSEVKTHLIPHLEKLAGSLVRDPSAARLRAPRTSLRKRTTAELIDAPLLSGGL